MKMAHLPKEELRSLISTTANPRHRLMFKVMYHHGLRVSEALALVKEDFFDTHAVFKRLKGSYATTQRLVSFPEDPLMSEAEELAELVASLGPGEKLFPMSRSGVWRLMQRTGKRAGIRNRKLLHPHAFKHSNAMHTIKTNGIEYVRQRLGHKSIASTGAYLKVTDQETDDVYERSLRSNLSPAA